MLHASNDAWNADAQKNEEHFISPHLLGSTQDKMGSEEEAEQRGDAWYEYARMNEESFVKLYFQLFNYANGFCFRLVNGSFSRQSGGNSYS